MSLSEQVFSMIFSFIYGIVLSILYNFNYNLLFSKTKISKVIFNLLFVLDLVLLYFLIIKKIKEKDWYDNIKIKFTALNKSKKLYSKKNIKQIWVKKLSFLSKNKKRKYKINKKLRH